VKLRFWEFELDLERRALTRKGEPMHLQPKVIELLVYLAENRDRVVPKQELLDALWPNTAVSESALTSAVRDARAALGDQASPKRSIKTAARRGYRFIAKVADGRSGEIFVGRRDVLDRLERMYERAASGAGQVAFLVGEPGIGKTACARSFATSLTAASGAVRESWCDRDRGTPPFWPWIQLLRSSLIDHSAESFPEALGPRLQDVARILPEIGASVGITELPPALSPDDARFRLFDSVTELIVHLSHSQPLLLVIDDLQWADASSLRLLHFAMRRLRSSRVMVLATFRTLEPLRNPDLAETLSELLRLPSIERIELPGLEVDDVAEWLRAVRGDDRDAQPMAARTRGNPLFVRQLIGSGLDSPNAGGLPDLIRSQLNHCSEAGRLVLASAAVLGRDLDEALLGRVANLPSQELSAALDEACLSYLLRARSRGGYEFANPLIRDIVYDEIRTPDRAELHGRVVDSIRDRIDPAVPDSLAAISDHLIAAGTHANLDDRIDFAVRAGTRAMGQSAHGEAARCFGQALDALGLLKDAAPRRSCWVLLACGEAESAAGLHRVRAVSRFEAAADLAREHGMVDEFAQAALGFGSLSAAIAIGDTRLVDVLTEALDLLGDREDALVVHVRSRLATELYGEATRAQGRALARETLDMARQLGDPLALGSALMAQLIYVGTIEAGDACRDASLELAQVAERSQNPAFELWGYHWRLVSALLDARRDDFDRLLERYRPAADRHRIQMHMDLCTLAEVTRETLDGELRDAADLIARMRTDELTQANWMSSANVGFQDLWLRNLRDNVIPIDVVEAFYTQPIPPDFAGATKSTAALLFAEGGWRERAQEALYLLVEDDFAAVPNNMFRILCLAALARTACLVGHRASCEQIYEALLPYAGKPVTSSIIECIGFADHYLACTSTELAEYDRAERHFQAALEQAERMRAPVFVAQTQAEYADALCRRRRRGDLEKAFELLSSSVSGCTSCGLTRAGKRARLLLDGLRAA
jgi:DNA-binding winged helix-turn-helix (wHTH) protein